MSHAEDKWLAAMNPPPVKDLSPNDDDDQDGIPQEIDERLAEPALLALGRDEIVDRIKVIELDPVWRNSLLGKSELESRRSRLYLAKVTLEQQAQRVRKP